VRVEKGVKHRENITRMQLQTTVRTEPKKHGAEKAEGGKLAMSGGGRKKCNLGGNTTTGQEAENAIKKKG